MEDDIVARIDLTITYEIFISTQIEIRIFTYNSTYHNKNLQFYRYI